MPKYTRLPSWEKLIDCFLKAVFVSCMGSPSGTDLIQTWPVFAARTETAWAAQKCHQLAVARQRGGFGRIIEVRKLRPKQGGCSRALFPGETRPQQQGCADQGADPSTARSKVHR